MIDYIDMLIDVFMSLRVYIFRKVFRYIDNYDNRRCIQKLAEDIIEPDAGMKVRAHRSQQPSGVAVC